MERNLDERVEVLVPVEDMNIRRMLGDGNMHANLKDTKQSWLLGEDNVYQRVQVEAEAGDFDAQQHFMSEQHADVLGPFPSKVRGGEYENG